MSEIIKFCNPMIILADYKNPERHKHLASHIIISLGDEMEWLIENENVKCRGICIDSNVIHTGKTNEEGSIVFIFTDISRYAVPIKEKYLKGNPYEVIDDDIVDRVIKEYVNNKDNTQKLDSILLHYCGIDNSYDYCYEERVKKIISYINGLETIEKTIVEDLSNKVYLSKSRLSHLFREQTGMTLHSYLAFEKFRKTYKYYCEGMNITEACMLAGFGGSSHCASTCKRMFGISLRDVYKTMKK